MGVSESLFRRRRNRTVDGLLELFWVPVIFAGFFMINPWLGAAVTVVSVTIYLAGLWRFEKAQRARVAKRPELARFTPRSFRLKRSA
jgi:hypothetical protein